MTILPPLAAGTGAAPETDSPNFKAILALKIKRRRKACGLTLTALADACDVSPSYVAEIESGKKYPKPDTLLRIATALNCLYDELISTRPANGDQAVFELLNAPGIRNFPFDTFGIQPADIVKLLTRSPTEVTALIKALADMGRLHEIGVEHFVHAALRAYQSLTGNYYEALERQAEDFRRELMAREHSWDVGALKQWVIEHCNCAIDERTIGRSPLLSGLRSVFIDSSRTLFLNPALADSQKAFTLARHAAYHLLGAKARSLTSPPDRQDSFEQVRNDFEASYFAGALLLPRKPIVADLKAWLRSPAWQPELLLTLLDRYQVTPETLVHRMSQLIRSQLGLPFRVTKFVDTHGTVRLTKHLNLSEGSAWMPYATSEHFCRRWVSLRSLAGVRGSLHHQTDARPTVAATYARFFDAQGPRQFEIAMTTLDALQPDAIACFVFSFDADKHFSRVVRFASDRSLTDTIVGRTCERCAFDEGECLDRVAPATLYRQQQAAAERQRAILSLDQSRQTGNKGAPAASATVG